MVKMDANRKTYSNPNPKLYANFLSRLIFSWLFPLFKYGQNHKLIAEDLYNVLPEDTSETLGDQLESCWNKELKNASTSNKNPKFLYAIIKYLRWSYVKYGINMFLLNMFVRVTQPLVLGSLLSLFYHDSTTSVGDAYLYTTILLGLVVLQVLLIQHANFGLGVVGMRLRIACSSLIYRKMTRLSCASVLQVSRDSILNLLSSDVVKFDNLFMSLHYVWIVPLQSIAMTYMIWQRIGIATLAGIGFMTMTTIPIQFLLGRLISKLRMKVAAVTDRRILILSELIGGIRAIKTYVWEKPFEQLVDLTRRKEIGIIKIYSYLKGISLATLMFTNLTTLFFTLLVYVLQGNAISANTVYVITYYYYYLRLTLTYHFPNAINFVAEANVSVKRIEKFLLLEEVRNSIEYCSTSTNSKCIRIKNVNAKWSSENWMVNTLSDINISISQKKLYAIVGPVGAGKSSFLKLILGELQPKSGQVSVCGSTSYASQEPWLFTGSVRSNILFGQPYDEVKYRQVIEVCALDEDFERLPHGDKTLVGDRGASLSGGQCARVNLARAVYRDVDIYLFDDPLSAVDAEVGKQLFYNCINGYLSNKTRIVVTHQVQYLKKADSIIFFNDGQVEFQGTYSKFENDERLIRYLSLVTEKSQNQTTRNANSSLILRDHVVGESEVEKDEDEEHKETEELIARKEIKESLLWNYFRAGGSYFLLFATILCFILAQALLSASTYWIAYWTQREDLPLNASDTEEIIMDDIDGFDSRKALYTLGGLAFASVFMCIISNVLLFKTCMDANRNIHRNMLLCLLRAPMRFFNVNPAGQILNRFSKDTAAADEILPVTILQTIQWCSMVIGNVLQVLIVNWLTAFPVFIVFYLYAKIKNVYMATAQNIKRLESVAKSPVFSHVSSSLSGLLTIRSCGMESFLHREFDAHQNTHTEAHFLVVASSVAFGFWIDAVSVIYVVLVGYSFLLLVGYDTFTASQVGLTMTQAIGLCGSMQSCMKNYGDSLAQLTSVERLMQFTELPQEEASNVEDEDMRPAMFWPSKGEIKFERLWLRYAEEREPALRDLSFTIEPGMKVGIVGRTGAGKSSLVAALFRLAKIEGSLYIDGIDTQKIGLVHLREKISFIPQESIIFTGSVRNNLDAFGRFDDSLLWSALEAVELRSTFNSLDVRLEYGGDNLSVGQRQLLCLARAILENNRILVLDEATANVDPATDELIRQTIRRQFKDCTVLTIAHRLNTIVDSDLIIVMDKGRILEYDKPDALMTKRDGHLFRMVEQSGEAMAEQLRRIVSRGCNEE